MKEETLTTGRDSLVQFGKSCIQHGMENDRVYLVQCDPLDYPGIIGEIENLAGQYQYGKILAKVPSTLAPGFIASGFVIEAAIPSFFDTGADAYFMSKFLKLDRINFEAQEFWDFQKVLDEPPVNTLAALPVDYRIEKMEVDQPIELSLIPGIDSLATSLPGFDTSCLPVIGDSRMLYYGAWQLDQLVGLISASFDEASGVAEIHHLVTGESGVDSQDVAPHLLHAIESRLTGTGCRMLFSICPVKSTSTNRAFIDQGYHYAGSLVNNSIIAGQIESMNVFYKLAKYPAQKRTTK
jgi:beta-lysine N6-acetyltransferase